MYTYILWHSFQKESLDFNEIWCWKSLVSIICQKTFSRISVQSKIVWWRGLVWSAVTSAAQLSIVPGQDSIWEWVTSEANNNLNLIQRLVSKSNISFQLQAIHGYFSPPLASFVLSAFQPNPNQWGNIQMANWLLTASLSLPFQQDSPSL